MLGLLQGIVGAGHRALCFALTTTTILASFYFGALTAEAQELTEGNAFEWGTFADDSRPTAVSDDETFVKVGRRSLKFVTASGFDTGVTYPWSGNAHWDLRSKDFLTFWTYAINSNPGGFQGNQPVVVLKSANGSFRYAPRAQLTTIGAWTLHRVPLAGDNSEWIRTTTGSPTLADISQLEIHQDTWDYGGFTVYYDGVEFITLTISSLTLLPLTQEPYEGWQIPATLTAITNLGAISIPLGGVISTSSNPAVAIVDANGKIRALSAGTATITVTVNGVSASIQIRVKAPVRPPVYERIDPYLATPAADALYVVPIVILRYLPTEDGTNLDVSYDPDYYFLGRVSLDELKRRMDTSNVHMKFITEEGSRFRGYRTPPARPSIGCRVVDYITIYEPIPPGKLTVSSKGLPTYQPDYHQILTRFNAQHYVNDLGVREFWLWGGGMDASFPSYDPSIHKLEKFRWLDESNMSSPTTGDVSNSFRDNTDMPVYQRTYVLYGHAFRRTDVEAHGRGHQLEAILGFVNQRQDGNTNLFWKQFVGQDANGKFITGRSGWTHMPPNTITDYDYANMSLVESDIEDWTPARTGQRKLVNALTWASIPYVWPDGLPQQGQKFQQQWYIYWMQNMPGLGNTIPNGLGRMTNWWAFTADWDASIRAGLGLHTSTPCNPVISPTGTSVSADGGTVSVNVTPVACPWIAVSNADWIRILSGSIGSSSVSQVLFSVAPNTSANPRTGTLAIAGQTFTVSQAGRP